MSSFLSTVTGIIQKWGPWGVFGAGVVEQIIVPIPSPIVPMGGGFFLVEKNIALKKAIEQVFFKVALPFSLGSTLGSSLVFLLAFFGGAFLINKFQRYLEFDWKDIERFKKRFFKGKVTDELLIFVFMAIPIIPSSFISAVCGAIRIKMSDFYFFTFLGLLTRGLILGFFGWWAGEAYWEMAEGVNQIESLVFLFFGLLAFALLVWGYLKRDKWLKKC
ncbi:VTT domain-containing protein [Candidatus Shapirobacteria bacterium]|nr:VTT domain-containing protein [Candidatus Shapirobacteria bacterium]